MASKHLKLTKINTFNTINIQKYPLLLLNALQPLILTTTLLKSMLKILKVPKTP